MNFINESLTVCVWERVGEGRGQTSVLFLTRHHLVFLRWSLIWLLVSHLIEQSSPAGQIKRLSVLPKGYLTLNCY